MSGNLNHIISIRPNKTNTKITANMSNLNQIDSNLQALNLTSGEIPTEYMPSPDVLSPVRDQKSCGSCWAMSSTSVLSDRFMLMKGIKNLELDPLIPVSCSTNDAGCNGGQPSSCGKFFENVGCSVKSSTCQGWDEFCATDQCQNPPACSALNCPNNYKAIEGSTKSLVVMNPDGTPNADLTIINIKTEIMKNGSVVCSTFVPFAIYDPSYWPETNGVFMVGKGFYDARLKKQFAGQSVAGTPVDADNFTWDSLITEDGQPAGHAMAIIGWGTTPVSALNNQSVEYWTIRNSWGTSWADGGFFKYAIYNAALGINITTGLDVPVQSAQGLFGGCTMFMPDTNSGGSSDLPPHGEPTIPLTIPKKTIQYAKYAVYCLLFLIVLYLLFKLAAFLKEKVMNRKMTTVDKIQKLATLV